MTEVGPTSQRSFPQPDDGSREDGTARGGEPAAPQSPALERARRLSAGNMLRSLAPLVLICLAVVGYVTWLQEPGDPVRPIDPSTTIDLAASRAEYPVLAPRGLPEGYRPTSARTDAGNAEQGEPVTLEIGYVTPSEEYAGFVVSDDRSADPVAAILDGAEPQGTVTVDGESWTRSRTERGETALSRESDGVRVVVTGSAVDDELETVAAAVSPVAD